MAIVVGVVLSLVKQGSVIADVDATFVTWVRVAVNFFVPFVVSSIGYPGPLRRRTLR